MYIAFLMWMGRLRLPSPAEAGLSKGRILMSNVALRLVEGIGMDKEKALEAAISQIERGFGKGSIMRLGQNEKAV